MIVCALIKKDIFDGLAPQIKREIRNASELHGDAPNPQHLLSGIEYYVFKGTKEALIATQLKYCSFFYPIAYKKIIETKEFNEDDPQVVSDADGYNWFKPQGNTINLQPFASKVLDCGKKLYRRKHGIRKECLANATTVIDFVVPYAECKIDEVEIVNCTGNDSVDLKIKDTVAGSYSGVPNYTLEQFGYSVCLSDLYYTDTSNYDATLYQGMIVEVTYNNNEADAKQIGINIVLHEVK